MLAAHLRPASKLNDSLLTTTQTLAQPTKSTTTTNSSLTNQTIVANNQETDDISGSQTSNRYKSPILLELRILNNDERIYNNSNKTTLQKNKRNSININGFSRDVIDNKTDNFLTPPFCNIKRMTEIYCNENERLKTFLDWPLDFIDKIILAKIGFFFTGDDDKVRCYFCDVEIGRWEVNDNPVSEHTRWSPNCPLIKRRQTSNVPIDIESLNRILPPVSYDVCGSNDFIEVRPNAYAEGSISPTSPIGSPMNSLPNTPNSVTSTTQNNFRYPDHPEYAIESARFRSFTDWPRTMKQKPEQLSEAGFFYTGVGDRVKCFSCGGGLKDWDENDDPWEQHALWLGNCHYLKLIKGTSYIQSVAEKFKTAEEESKELERNENEDDEENQQQQGTSNINLGNNNNSDENTNVASTSSNSSLTLKKSSPISEKSLNIKNNCNNYKSRNTNSSCSSCSSSNNSTSHHQSSDEENGSSSGSESLSSVNSNSSKEAETVCKQPKLDCHHHHISRNLSEPKKSITISEEKLCKICYAAEYNTAFLPCGHVVACAKCASSVTKCPMCRKPFTDVMRVYFS